MKAILVKNGGLEICEVADPVEKENEILIEIHAAALNRADLLQKKGTYPSPKGWPEWPGLELSGKILSMGKEAKEKSGYNVGDKVCALVGGGAYAEKICVPYQLTLPMPKNLSYEEAAAIPEAYTTSYLNLFKEGHLKKGQTVYVAAGASGLASAAIPMAKGFGAKVITDCIDETKIEKITDLGADYIVDLNKEKVSDAFRRADEEGNPVNCAMDCLCGEDMGVSMQYMAEGGYWVVISTLAGITTNLYLRPLLTRGLHVVGSMLRKRSVEEKGELLREVKDGLWSKFEDGSVKVKVYKTFPFEKAEEAQAVLEKNENVGKVVLKVR